MKRQIKIGEIAEINANSLTQKDMFHEIMYLDTGNITRNEIDNIQILNITMDKIPSRAKRKVKDKTIIYSTVRPNQEHYGFLENPSDNFIVSTGFSTIDVYDDNTDEKFIYYLLTQKHVTDYLHTIGENSVSSYPSINPDDIANLKFTVPYLKTQQSIAAVLSALDKKIALNKQINARLEEMAKTLYDYWFVQFDFPDANGKPYKSSGGEMVFDETLKRKIPKGWKVKSLKDVLVNRSDNIKSEDLTSNMPYTPIDSLPMRKMTFSDFQKIENARTSLIRYSFNDILIGAMRVYFHRVCIAPFDGITRSTTIVLKPKKQNHLPFLYQLCNEEKTINFASKVSIGTQQPYVNWVNGLAEYKFAMPNLELIERYSIKIMPLIKSVITREKQNHHLTQLRDFLLPMLMNGQVSVAE
ncbi:restriction endonuclease subunit S [Neisseria lactamica]|uniref:restriction endonuclease subunit S n=1 Tax=Neisseria lactamica TaxID=486 RepID=UPI0027E15968|nr:restriction endonuclease subunit S [Neisseria lactamica]